MNWKTVFISALVAAIISLVIVKGMESGGAGIAKKETVYDKVIRTGTLQCGYVVWPGAFEIDVKTGKKSGINYEIAEAWAKKLGIKINWAREVISGQHIQDLNNGAVDANCTCDGPFNYRAAAQIDYSHAYAYVPFYLYGRKEDVGKYKSREELNNPNIIFSTFDGDVSSVMADEEYPKAKTLAVAANADPSLLVENVLTKKADVVILDNFTIYQVGKKLGYLKELFPEKQAVFPCAVSTRKGETELLNMINQGIDLINNLGITEKITKQNHMDGLFLYPGNPYRDEIKPTN